MLKRAKRCYSTISRSVAKTKRAKLNAGPFYGHVARLINNSSINYNKQLKNATGPHATGMGGDGKGLKTRACHAATTLSCFGLAKQLNACHRLVRPVHANWANYAARTRRIRNASQRTH